MQKENKNVDLSSLKDFDPNPIGSNKNFPRKTQQKRKFTKKNILTQGKKFKGAAKSFRKRQHSQLKDWVLDVNPTPEVLLALKNKIKTSEFAIH